MTMVNDYVLEEDGGLYLHWWAEESTWTGKRGRAAMMYDFQIGEDALEGVEILLASYNREDYEGHVFVLFRQNGKLWEVNGYHCSCYGLEDQWKPEETSVEALRFRMEKGELGWPRWPWTGFAKELGVILLGAEAGVQD